MMILFSEKRVRYLVVHVALGGRVSNAYVQRLYSLLVFTVVASTSGS